MAENSRQSGCGIEEEHCGDSQDFWDHGSKRNEYMESSDLLWQAVSLLLSLNMSSSNQTRFLVFYVLGNAFVLLSAPLEGRSGRFGLNQFIHRLKNFCSRY